jgi:hypothetical protein
MAGLTFYDVLGIERDADEQTVRRALRAQQRATHPDTTRVDSHVQYDLVMRAGQTLTDPAKRAAYDASLDAPADPWATSAPQSQPTRPAAPVWGPGAYAAAPQQAAVPAPAVVPEPSWTDPGGPRARRNTTVWLCAGGTLALAGILVASILFPTMAPITLVAAFALAVVGIFTWRRGGWTLKPMLVTNAAVVALALMLAATDPAGGPPLEHMARLDSWSGSIGLLLVLIGVDAATVRLTVRRRALYEWTPQQ